MKDDVRNDVRASVRLFGPQAGLSGRRTIDVRIVPGVTTCADVLTQLESSCAALTDSLASSRLAVDHELATTDTRLTGDEELALIGMVGGG